MDYMETQVPESGFSNFKVVESHPGGKVLVKGFYRVSDRISIGLERGRGRWKLLLA